MKTKILLVLFFGIKTISAVDSSWDSRQIKWFKGRLIDEDSDSRKKLVKQYRIYEDSLGSNKVYKYTWDLGVDLQTAHYAVEEMLAMNITGVLKMDLEAGRLLIKNKMKEVSRKLEKEDSRLKK